MMRKLKGKNVLITGGAGFIGGFLAERIAKENPAKLIIQDNLLLGRLRNLEEVKDRKGFRFYKSSTADYSALKKIIEKEKIDVVFNLAIVPITMCFAKPEWTFEENVKMTLNLCKLARLKKFKTLVHCSSSEVYGTALKKKMDENHPILPRTTYAASKAATDHLVNSYFNTYGIDVFIVRPFNNYGPRQNEKPYPAVIPLTMERILKNKSPIINGDGSQTRDFTFVKDTADMIVKLYSAKNTKGNVFNIAANNEVTIKNLILTMMKFANCKKNIIYAKKRPGDVERHRADITLLKKTIKIGKTTKFREGLKETVQWYIKHGEFQQ